MMTPLKFAILTSLALVTIAAAAQDGETNLTTQTLVHADSKADVVLSPTTINLQVNSKSEPLISLAPIQPANVQIALLIDDGLSRSSGLQIEDIRKFVNSLPASTELLVGYMTNGRVEVASPFSTDRAAAAAQLRIPMGVPGQSASPYLCLSDFVKRWPGADAEGDSHKARFVMMLTNGVDPYNGSTSILNQNSPYVAQSISDAQRAGVAVYSIYYRDSGFRAGGSPSFSGQSYLAQVAEGTGGESYYEGNGNPVSLTPFLNQFSHAISETYVATFNAPAGGGGRDHLLRLRMTTSTPKLKLRVPDEVRPGNIEVATAQ